HVPTRTPNVDGQAVDVGARLDASLGRPRKIVVPATTARPQHRRPGQGPVPALQLDHRLDAGLAVRGDHEEPALGAGGDADVGRGPLSPPGLDGVLIEGRVLDPPFRSGMLAGAAAAPLAATATALDDPM